MIAENASFRVISADFFFIRAVEPKYSVKSSPLTALKKYLFTVVV